MNQRTLNRARERMRSRAYQPSKGTVLKVKCEKCGNEQEPIPLVGGSRCHACGSWNLRASKVA
jgi:predicted Zn-ribbon and HTH transcriptional regulator